MTEKRPIDKKRESGGMADIGTGVEGAILEMPNISNRLIVIMEKAIYELIMADTIDPKRTNINLPKSTHQLIINHGVNSAIVCRTFLTAKNLFKKDFFNTDIDIDKALTLSIDILPELATLEKEINEYLSIEKRLCDEYEQRKHKSESYAIPSMEDIETRCKSIFQKTNHIEQILMEIIILFYTKDGLTKQSHFPTFSEVINKKYGSEDDFSIFVNSTTAFMKLIRQLRDCLDHRLDTVKVKNFELQSNSIVLSPTIELNHKGIVLDRTSLSSFLPLVFENLIFIFENTIAYISNKNVKGGAMSVCVREIPETIRKYKFVKYSFWSPLGQGGFYLQ